MMKRKFIVITEIFLCSVCYGIGTFFFLFPHNVVLGGTSGISVILSSFFNLSSGQYLTAINMGLLVLAFVILGKGLAFRTAFGTVVTTLSVTVMDMVAADVLLVPNAYISTIIGAILIAVSSVILFSVDSSSGGTDVIALILKKVTSFNIGLCLFLTDIVIVVFGAICYDKTVFFCSCIGFFIKVLGVGLLSRLRLKKREKPEIDSEAPNRSA